MRSTIRLTAILCMAINEGGATNTTQVSLILPLLPAVSRCLEELFPTARKWSRPAELYNRRIVHWTQ